MKVRTSIRLDVTLVNEAKDILGTSELAQTVHQALEAVIRRDRLRRLAERDFPDLTPAALEALRQSRG
ncbi:MAG TPA: hypothetical protein VMV93_13095 [Chloroflexota bacterium]|nr:hypothetical protein [Chloroflexota bacterium]